MGAMLPSWSTSKLDWKECILAGESLMPCQPLYPDVARDVRDGVIEDNQFLPLLYELPEEMIEAGEHLKPENFYVTNPNLGASVSVDYLEKEFLKASQDKTTLADFLAKHLNVEIGMNLRANRWAGAEFWNLNVDKEVSIDLILEKSDVVVIGGDGGGIVTGKQIGRAHV